MKKYLLPLIIPLFLTCSVGVKAQLNYKKGYIISLKNDTISGLINDGGGIRNSKVCLYKPTKNSKTIKYYPSDIKSFLFIGDKHYCSKEVFYKDEFGYVFTDVLLEGEVNLYFDRKNKEMAYYIERKEGEMIGLLNKELSLRGQSEYGYLAYNKYERATINVYKDTLYSFFKESTKIQKLVGTVEYDHKSLINITKAYINETCKQNDCIRYEKDLTQTRDRFGLFSGIQLSKIVYFESEPQSVISRPKYQSEIVQSLSIGIFYNIPLPLISDRLSFQLELIANYFNSKPEVIIFPDTNTKLEITSKTFDIPLLLKYKIPVKKISPTFSFGKETGLAVKSYVNNRHQTQKGGWFFEFGVDYDLKPKLSLFSNIRFQSFKNLIVGSIDQVNRLPFYAILNSEGYEVFKTNFTALYFGIKF